MRVLKGFEDAVKRLLSHFERCPLDRYVTLPRVGRFKLQALSPYQPGVGVSTEVTKFDVFWSVHPSLLAELNGDPPAAGTQGVAKPDPLALKEFAVELRESILKDGEVEVPAFGHFLVKTMESRRGINPQTGEEIQIPPRKVVTFKKAPGLRERIAAARHTSKR
jgi:nucleoid DNA-binding protein